MKYQTKGTVKQICRYLMLSCIMICMLGIASVVQAAGIPSNLQEQIQPSYQYRVSFGSASLAGEEYDDCLVFDTFNSIPGKATFYLEGKYKSISFCTAHQSGKQTRTVAVYCDDMEVWAKPVLLDDLPQRVTIDLSGVQKLEFRVSGSPSSFQTVIANINLVNNGYSREERMKEVKTNFLTNIQPYNSNRYIAGDFTMGDKNFVSSFGFDTFNSITGHATYNLKGYFKTLSFWLGNERNSVSNQTRTVTITGDGAVLFSKAVNMSDVPTYHTISVADVHQLKITVSGTPSSYQVVFGGVNLVSDGIVRSNSLDQTSLSLSKENQTTYLRATILPTDAVNQTILWSSSDEEVATVNSKGLVKAVADGEAVITARTAQGGYASECKVKVTGMTVEMKDTGITVSSKKYTYTGEGRKPSVKVTYDGTTLTKNVDYTLSYANNVNAGTGTVTIKGKGRFSGSVTRSFTIYKASQSVKASVSSEKLVVGKSGKIVGKGKGKITYSSSNSKVAAVSSTGVITAKWPGTVKITVKAAGNDNYKAAKKTITIVVNPKSTKITSGKTSGKGKIAVKWSKISNVTGYQVRYVYGSSKKTISVSKYYTSKTLSGLKKGRTYKIYVRTYKKSGSKTYYSAWSSAKSVKVTK